MIYLGSGNYDAHKAIQRYWGEESPIDHYTAVFLQARSLFIDEGCFDQAINNIGVLADIDAANMGFDGVHMQVPTAARAVVYLLPYAIEKGFQTGHILSDQDKLAVVTAAAAHDVLGESHENSSAIGDIDAITSALQYKKNTPETINTVQQLIANTDYKDPNNPWFQMGPHVPGQFMKLGNLTAQLPDSHITSHNFIKDISNQFDMDPKFMMMASVTVLSDFLGIVTARRYPDIAQEMYPHEVSPPIQIINLIDKLLYLQGVSPEGNNRVVGNNDNSDDLLTRYRNLRYHRLRAN